jgi:outer membrane protein
MTTAAPVRKACAAPGPGLAATIFFSENTRGALAGSDLELDTSFGPAAQFGIDIDVGSTWFMNPDTRWIDVETKSTLDGVATPNHP